MLRGDVEGGVSDGSGRSGSSFCVFFGGCFTFQGFLLELEQKKKVEVT